MEPKQCCGSTGAEHAENCPAMAELDKGTKPEADKAENKPEEKKVGEDTKKEEKAAQEPKSEASEPEKADDDTAVEEVIDEGGEEEEISLDSPADFNEPEIELGAEDNEEEEVIDATTIGKELEEHEAEEAKEDKEEEPAKPKARKALDLDNFSPDQLDILEEAINRIKNNAKKPKQKDTIIGLRHIEGKPIIAFSKAYKKPVFDEDEQKERPRTHIKVRVEGEDKDRIILYREFNNLPRLKCKLISTDPQERIEENGEVMSAQHKTLVPMEVRFIDRILKLRLPDGRLLKINADLVN